MVFASADLFPPPNNPRVPVPPEEFVLFWSPSSTLLASNSNHTNPFQYSKCAESVLKRMEPGGQSDGLSAVVPFGGIKYC